MPLDVTLSGANRDDSMMLAATLDAVPGMRTRHRGPPHKLQAGQELRPPSAPPRVSRPRSIKPRIARRSIESGWKPGPRHWVVEHTFAWLNQVRRLTVRYERRADLHLALTTLACTVICLRQVGRFCC